MNNITIKENKSFEENKIQSLDGPKTNYNSTNDNKILYYNKTYEINMFYNKIFNSLRSIINIGNTCFINLVLQILFHTKKFIDKFIECKNNFIKNIYSISYKFYPILKFILLNDETKEEALDISEFVYFIFIKQPQYNFVQQYDCQEFLRIFLDYI